MICSTETSVALASRSGKAVYSDGQQRCHPIARHHLSSLVQKLNVDVLSKILQRHFCTQKRTRLIYQVGPIFELRVMRHTAFQYDGLKLRKPRRFSGSAWITTLSMFDHFSAPLQCTNLCNTDDYSPIPTHLKLKSGF